MTATSNARRALRSSPSRPTRAWTTPSRWTVLDRGEVQRTSHALVEAGGKGVNVARALAKHGHPTTAILPAGDDAQRMIGLLTPQQVSTVAVPIAGAIRTNIAVVEQRRHHHQAQRARRHAVRRRGRLRCWQRWTRPCAAVRAWLVAAGSLPAGAPDDFYAQVTKAAVAVGVPVAIDTSGPALAAAIDAGATVVKPNLEELEEVLGRDLVTVGDVIDAAEGTAGPRLQGPAGQPGRARRPADHGRGFVVGRRPTAGPAEHRRRRRLHAVRLPAHRRHPCRTTCRGGGLGPGRLPATR